MLGLAVAVLVTGVGRSRGDADREEGQERRDQIDPGVRGLGEQAEAVRGEAGAELQPDEGGRCEHGDERSPPLRCHGTSVFQASGSSGQTTTSWLREKWQSGSPSTWMGEIDVRPISASAGWSGQSSWWISARLRRPRRSTA